MMYRPLTQVFSVIGLGLSLALLGACGKAPEEKPAARRTGPPPVLIATTTIVPTKLEVVEETVATLEDTINPRIAAEVPGKVVNVTAYVGKPVRQGELLAEIDSRDFDIQNRSDEAEIKRIENLLAQSERVVQRQTELQKQGFFSQNAVEDVTANRNALREQLVAARARSDGSRNAIRKTRILSPINGRVETKVVTAGDYVRIGDPLFQVVGTHDLQAHLPFPESASVRIRVNLPVRLSSPLLPEQTITAKINEIRPTITPSSRALDAIVVFQTDGTLRGGGTMNAQVVTSVRDGVFMVPEQSVVLRPAGKVVYVINGDKAEQRLVETGVKQDGKFEITSGLNGGESIATDGAAFLTDGSTVMVPGDRGGKPGEGKPGRGDRKRPDRAGDSSGQS